MDTGVSPVEETDEGDFGLQRENSEKVRPNDKSKEAQSGCSSEPFPEEINDIDQLKITADHLFPNFNNWIRSLEDPRAQERVTFAAEHLVWLGLLLFIFRFGSRWQLYSSRKRGNFRNNLNELTGKDNATVAHPDTLNYFLKKLPVEEMEDLKVVAAKQLIRDKRLLSGRLFGEYRVAIDATGLFSFDKRHCDQCLTTKHSNGKIVYSHKILEAKLITDEGMAISICSEPIENPHDGHYDKQDCELKAFYRLVKKLRKAFPRTSFCLILDGLYACKEVFDHCRDNFWSFVIVFKKGSIPTLWKESQRLLQKHPNNQAIISEKNKTQALQWVHHLNHAGRIVHVIFCTETTITGNNRTTKQHAWVTDIRPTEGNVHELANRGGRARWKIENEGFNDQKTHDYDLEHVYGNHPNAWKNYYQLLQIAHMIVQLMCCGDLCTKLHQLTTGRKTSFLEYYSSVKEFIESLKSAFRYLRFSLLSTQLPGKVQIRFSSA